MKNLIISVEKGMRVASRRVYYQLAGPLEPCNLVNLTQHFGLIKRGTRYAPRPSPLLRNRHGALIKEKAPES